MHIRQLEPSDYDAITQVVDAWWGGRPMRGLLPRLFFDHFCDTSLVAEDDGQFIGFLIGFSSAARVGEAYIHFVGVHPSYRQRGVGRALSTRFFGLVQRQGCSVVRCITTLLNRASIAFHTRMGFALEPGSITDDGVAFTPAYDGPGHDRVRFVKHLANHNVATDARYGALLHHLAAIAAGAFAAGRLADALAALEYGRSIAALDDVLPAARAAFLLAASRIAGWHASLGTGDYAAAQRDLDAAHALAQASGDALLLAQTLDALGFLHYQQALTTGSGDFATAAALAQQALDQYEAHSDERGTWAQRFRLALIDERGGRFEEAAAAFAQVYEAAQTLGDRSLQSEAVRHLGFAAWRADDFPTAQARFAEALALTEQAGQHVFTPFAHLALGDTAQLQQQWTVAERHYETGLALAAQLGLARAVVQTQFSLGEAQEAQGRTAEALALYQAAYAGAQAISFAAGIARIEAKLQALGAAPNEGE